MKTPIKSLLACFAGLLVVWCMAGCGTVSDETRDAANQQPAFIPNPANSPASFPANC